MLKKIIYLSFTILSFIAPVHAKTVLITGASGDIGLALVKNFIAQGDFVICHYAQHKETLEQLQKEHPDNIAIVQADFNNPTSLQSFWDAILKIKNKVDVLINSAGIEQEDTSFEQIQKTININYLSPRLICDYVIEHFHQQKIKGIIINIGSRAVYRGLPKGYYTYSDSKSALTRYSQNAARDNAKDGISVYVVAPGPVEGKMYLGLREDIRAQCLASLPTGQVIKVQEVVDMIDLLASGKVPSSTGGVFDLMGASWSH